MASVIVCNQLMIFYLFVNHAEIGAVIEDDKGKQFPIKISVTYQKPKLTESIYIFKYIRNKVNETAIEVCILSTVCAPIDLFQS